MIFQTLFLFFFCAVGSFNEGDPLPSWNEGRAKEAIIDFVRATTQKGSADFVPPEERIATFDQDGTLWVEHPLYTQAIYCIDRVPQLVQMKPYLRYTEPYKTVIEGKPEKIAKLSLDELKQIAIETLTGMTVEQFQKEVSAWIKSAKDKRWNRLYTQLVYQPMKEVLDFLRANGYKTYIATGGGQDFVRVYAQEVYGIPPEQVIGTPTKLNFSYDKKGDSFLTKEPKLLFNDNDAGKPEGIQFMIGRRPYAAFGNSIGDQQMLEYTHSGEGKRLAMLVLHDDPKREYAYGPAQGLPDTQIGTFTKALYDEAKNDGWVIISMKKDWKRIFRFD